MKRELAVAALVALEFAVFYPRASSYVDEREYVSFARVLASGNLYYERTDVLFVPGVFSLTTPRGTTTWHPPGNALTLVPFVRLGHGAVFAHGLVLLLVAFAGFATALRFARLNPLYGALFLLFPPALLLSRTAMSEPLALAMVSWALVAHVKGRHAACAFLLGLGALARLSVPLLALPLVAWLLLKRRPRSALSAVLSLAAGLVPTLLFAALVWGTVPVTNSLDLAEAPSHLLHDLVVTALLPPLLLPLSLLSRRRELLVCGVLFLLAVATLRYYDTSPSLTRDAVLGWRLLLPAAPFLLLTYVEGLDRLGRRVRDAPLYALLALFAAASVPLSLAHRRFTALSRAQSDAIYANTPPGALVVGDKEVFERLDRTDARRFADYWSLLGDSCNWRLAPSSPAFLVLLPTVEERAEERRACALSLARGAAPVFADTALSLRIFRLPPSRAASSP